MFEPSRATENILEGLREPQWPQPSLEPLSAVAWLTERAYLAESALDAALDELDLAHAQLARMRGALDFYADRSRYCVDDRIPHAEKRSVMLDFGKRARSALVGDGGLALFQTLRRQQQRIDGLRHHAEQLQGALRRRKAEHKAELAAARARADEAEKGRDLAEARLEAAQQVINAQSFLLLDYVIGDNDRSERARQAYLRLMQKAEG